jgi:hypothetical protein
MEDEVLANAGVDVFEELFKLIFTKLYDSFFHQDDGVREIGSTSIRSCLARCIAECVNVAHHGRTARAPSVGFNPE